MYKFFKRFFDVICCLLAFPIFCILFIFIAIAIKIEDGGPIFYKAERIGKNSKKLCMYKFRSMKVNAPNIVNEDGSTRYIRKPIALDDDISKTIPRGFVASSIRAVIAKQPSTIELQEEYNRGRKEAKEDYERQAEYQRDYVRKQYDRLKTLDEIERRFRLWGDDIDALDEFEAFRKFDPAFVKRAMESAKKAIIKVEEYFKATAK